MGTNKATILIESCGECPHVNMKRYYTADTFEHEYEYECYCVSPVRKIGITDKMCPIPDWCPCKIK